MSAIAITGLPGTGKTHLAINLGAKLTENGNSVLLLHTDILKVTLRQFLSGLSGPGYAGDFQAKAQLVRPFLEAQTAKAVRDGYILIIEGTLALGFVPSKGLHVFLELDENQRKQREKQKHFSAKQTLQRTSLAAYRKALEFSVTNATLRLDAALPVRQLTEEIERYLIEPPN
ncbi:MAG: zeta toxin family protein [Cyanobacteriota bacterium]|nr:zeta toxin family protein [Cyanobacteriota bacterium]